MRVGIIAAQHESNTFLTTQTTLDDFARDVLASGPCVRDRFAAAHHEIGGFFEGCEREELDPVPIFAARAVPSGVIATDACEALVSMMLDALRAAGTLDGLLVAPHGAGVCQSHPDFDGHWLSCVRQVVGHDIPIVCTLDLHANVSERMINACDATVAYRTNPHLDQRQRGIEAATLLARHLRRDVKLTQAAAMPRVAINIERQFTDKPPCRPFYDLADAQLAHPGILSNSIVLGFPYADVEEMGTSIIVVTDNNTNLARECAAELADYLLAHRHAFRGEMISIDAALTLAQSGPKPVCLLDTGDNVGGGSSADGTALPQALHQRGMAPSFAMIFDPQCVQIAQRAGIGARVDLTVGGKTDSLHGPPMQLTCDVLSLHDGNYLETQIRHGGWGNVPMGRCAVVRTDRGLTLLLTSQRVPPFSLRQVSSCGLDPSRFDYLVAKGVHAPVAAYREVCKRFIRVNTPGVTNADMTQLPYRRRRKPLFPFESLDATND